MVDWRDDELVGLGGETMKTVRILDVGNCGPDHAALSRMLKSGFGAEVRQTDHIEDTLAALAAESFDLVLINRKLDCDYSDGMEVLKRIKQHSNLSTVPVMLISNYEDAQAEAVAHGALLGFGKLQLNAPATRERLSNVFQPQKSDEVS